MPWTYSIFECCSAKKTDIAINWIANNCSKKITVHITKWSSHLHIMSCVSRSQSCLNARPTSQSLSQQCTRVGSLCIVWEWVIEFKVELCTKYCDRQNPETGTHYTLFERLCVFTIGCSTLHSQGLNAMSGLPRFLCILCIFATRKTHQILTVLECIGSSWNTDW